MFFEAGFETAGDILLAASSATAKRLKLRRPITVLDCETTSTDKDRARVIQFTGHKVHPDGNMEVLSLFIDPLEPIPSEITEITRITDAMVVGEPKFSDVALSIAEFLTDCDFAGHSVKFDLEILAVEMKRAKVAWDWRTSAVVDTYAMHRTMFQASLGAIFERLTGQKPDGAHQSDADVFMNLVVLAELATLKEFNTIFGPFADREDGSFVQWIQSLTNRPNPFKVDADGRFAWRNGRITVSFGKYDTVLLDSVLGDRGYWDWMLREGFSEDTKDVIREARAGQARTRRLCSFCGEPARVLINAPNGDKLSWCLEHKPEIF